MAGFGIEQLAFDVGLADEPFDLVVVDETHRLNQRASQASGMKNRQFGQINERLFTDFAEMVTAVRHKDEEVGLSRLVAGYAWPWRSRKDKSLPDIEIDSVPLQWNSTDVDWVNAPNAVDEVGSIHTVQGYDLNYAGVIIGRDLRWDTAACRLRFDRRHYFDAKGMENNRKLGITYDDEDLLRFVSNIYAVLLTRGMKGTFVYVCDPALREHLRTLIPSA